MKIQLIRLIRYFLLILGVIALVVFISSLDINQVKKSLSSITWDIILIVMILNALGILIKAFRWRILIYKISNVKPSLFFSFLSIIAGVSAASFTPGRGGDIAKPLMLKTSYHVSLTQSIPAMLIERILDLLSVIAFFFVAWIILPKRHLIYNEIVLPAMTLAILLVLCAFILPKKIERICLLIIRKIPISPKLQSKLIILIEKFFQSIILLRGRKVSISMTILSLAAFFVEIIKFKFLFMVFGITISLMLIAFSFTASLAVSLLSFVPGGIGVTELSFVAILTKMIPNYTIAKLTSVVLAERMLTYYLLILLGAIILIIYRKKEHPIPSNK